MRIDLHNHSYYSDGVLSPKQLLEFAQENGVDVFALTDHDSVFGCNEIVELEKDYNVRVIKGMELSTYYKGESVHIVCLFKDNIIPDSIYQFSVDLDKKRRNRAIEMMTKIHDIYNIKVDIDKLLRESKIITRANMMRNIAECNNLSYTDAGKYVNNDSKAYIPSTKMSVEEGLKLARNAGCFVIFAHPCLIKNQDYVEEILAYGFDGIEVKYPNKKSDINMENKLRKLANKYNLVCSAGSDFHGDSTHAPMGTKTLNEEEFEPIANWLNFKI